LSRTLEAAGAMSSIFARLQAASASRPAGRPKLDKCGRGQR